MSLESQRFYEFGAFRLNPSERRLLRGDKPVPLAPKACEALLALVESGGRVLGRDELIKRIWPDTAAGEANLAVTISSLRKTLGERPGGGLYIETVPKQGYRFAASVTESFTAADDAGRGPEVTINKADDSRNLAAAAVAARSPEKQPSSKDAAKHGFEKPASINQTSLSRPAAALAARTGFTSRLMSHKRAIAIASAFILVATVALAYFAFFKQAAKPAGPRRLAILPLRNLKPDSETDFLGFSLADAIITKLGYVGSLIVSPSSYVYKYQGEETDSKKAARELNVDTLMTGTFLKEGDDLRITMQLIDVSRDEILSTFPLNIKYDRLPVVQNQVAQNIVDKLHLKLTSAEAERLDQKATENNIAYEYFLRGTDMYLKGRYREAILLLEEAVVLDPNFALVWAHIGRAYNAAAAFNLRGREFHLKAQAACEQALKLNSNQTEASIFMANLFTDTNRVEESVPLLRNVLEAAPNIAEAHWEMGYAYRFAGMLDESIKECERARTLDSDQPQTRLMQAKLFTETGRVEQAIALLLELIKTSPNMAEAHWELSYAYRYAGMLKESIEEGELALQMDTRLKSHQFNSYLYTGQYEKFAGSLPRSEDAYAMFYRGLGNYYLNDLMSAAVAFDRAYELNPSSVISKIGKAFQLSIDGKAREGLEMLKDAEARVGKVELGDGEISYKLAQAYVALGDNESALRAFDRSIGQGFFCYSYFENDPLLKNMRSEAAFAAILEKARQRQDAFKRKLEQIAAR